MLRPTHGNPALSRSKCVARRHGDFNAYSNDGCRCPDAAVDWQRFKAALEDGTWQSRLVDSIGTRRRVLSLMALGWSTAAISREAGYKSKNGVHSLISKDRVQASSRDRMADLFDRLSVRNPPESTHHEKVAATKARQYAALHGGVVPMAWDDDALDDPEGQPATPERAPCLVDWVHEERMAAKWGKNHTQRRGVRRERRTVRQRERRAEQRSAS